VKGDQSLFTILNEGASIGIVGVVRSGALEGQDSELLCALKTSAEGSGFATEACEAVIAWVVRNSFVSSPVK